MRTLLVGLAAGFLSGVFGVGGGILVVPALVYLLGMDQRLAHGTSLAAVLPISAASLVGYAIAGNVDWPVAALLASGAVVGALIGTRLLHVLPHRALALVFAIVLIATAIRLFIPTEASGRASLTALGAIALVGVGVLTGILAGLLGVGGGVIMVPVMIAVIGIAPVVAKGTSVAVIIPTALMGTWRNRSNDNTDLRVAAAVGASGVVSALAGTYVSRNLDDTVSNVLFATLVLFVAARMLVDLRKPPAPDVDGFNLD